MQMTLLLLFVVLALTVAGAIGLVMARQLMHAAFWLLLVLLGVGAMFVFVGAEVLALSQLVVYVGGILILILFGVMLTQRQGTKGQISRIGNRWPAWLLVFGLGMALARLLVDFPVDTLPQNPPLAMGNVEMAGLELMTHWVLPLEVASLLLLVALVGAAFMARPDKRLKP